MSGVGEEDAVVDGPTVQDPFELRDPWAQRTATEEAPPSLGVGVPSGFGMQPGVSSNMAVTLPSTA